MAQNSGLFHRIVAGHLGHGAWACWRVAGKVFRVGDATYFTVKCKWDDAWGAEEFDAPVRGWKLATGELGKYG